MPATLNPNLRGFWETPARNRVLYGGRASSKSWDAAGVALFCAQATKLKVLCVRQFQNRIDDSVYTLLNNRLDDFGFRKQFQVLKSTIVGINGSEFIFYGLWRHIEEIKSTEGVDILWIEEAHALTKEQWEILEPTIRKEGSQVWVIFNPKLASDFSYQRFVVNPPPNTVVRKINYDENPFLSQTMLSIIDAKKAEDPDEFEHVYLGVPRLDDDEAIIKRSWLMAAIDAHKKLGFSPSGRKRLGFDIGDTGDPSATALVHGNVLIATDRWKAAEDELQKSASRVHAAAIREGAEIDYDSVGIGAFVGGHFSELNNRESVNVKYVKFNAGDAVVNPDRKADPRDPNSKSNAETYANLKAQAWWTAARRVRDTYNAVTNGHEIEEEDMISISSECEHVNALIDQLATPRKDEDARGKSKVESKKDLKRRGVASPNLADAFVAAIAEREVKGYDWGAIL